MKVVTCAALQSLVSNAKCSVTTIGRGIQSSATEKAVLSALIDTSIIKHFWRNSVHICRAHNLIYHDKQPLILIDVNNADAKKRHMVLRVRLALEGRSDNLRQDVKSMDDYNCSHVCTCRSFTTFESTITWELSPGYRRRLHLSHRLARRYSLKNQRKWPLYYR